MSELNDIVYDAHKSIDFGVVYLAIKKYDGKVATIDANQIVSHATPGGNVEALTNIGTMIKLESLSIKQNPPKTPPTATITLFWGKNGEVERLQVNGFKRSNLK
jgi:hypothetical protein